jgi:hypothetical protein
MKKEKKTILPDQEEKEIENQALEKEGKNTLPGYPIYPAKDDIYNRDMEEQNIDPEDISKRKSPNEAPGKYNEKDFADDETGGDLDVPGSELDDDQEDIGNEDEENNYYSLGGDSHNDLEEDKG